MEGYYYFMIDSSRDNDNNDKRFRENIFQIMDGIITQLNRTKKMFIIMILTIMIIPPISFIVTFALFGPPFPFHDDRMMPSERFGQGGFGPGFHAGMYGTISNFFNMVRNRNKAMAGTI